MIGALRILYRDRRWWLTLFAVGLLTLSTIVYMVEGGVEEGSYIVVEDVFFIMTDQDNSTTSMEIDVFITNHGGEELSDVTVRAFAVEEDSNLARDEAVAGLGSLDGDATIEGNLSITIPNGESYRVELLVFKEGKLAIQGSGDVNLGKSVEIEEPDGTVILVYDLEATNYTTNRGDSPPSDKDETDDGFGASQEDAGNYLNTIAVGAIVVLIVLVAKGIVGHYEGRPPRKRRPPTPPEEPGAPMYWYPPRGNGPVPPGMGREERR